KTEGAIRSNAAPRRKQTPTNIHPDTRASVKQWGQVMMGFVELRRICRRKTVAELEQVPFDDLCGGGLRQDVDVTHGSQVGLGVKLLANGDALEKRQGRGSSFAGPDHLVRGVQPLAGHYPCGQGGRVNQW